MNMFIIHTIYSNFPTNSSYPTVHYKYLKMRQRDTSLCEVSLCRPPVISPWDRASFRWSIPAGSPRWCYGIGPERSGLLWGCHFPRFHIWNNRSVTYRAAWQTWFGTIRYPRANRGFLDT